MSVKLRITIEVEIPDNDVEEAYKYLNGANESWPSPYGCAPIFWAIDEGMRSLGNKMEEWHRESGVKLQLVDPIKEYNI